jgi:uncharacterized protein YcbK (DUF882 family)
MPTAPRHGHTRIALTRAHVGPQPTERRKPGARAHICRIALRYGACFLAVCGVERIRPSLAAPGQGARPSAGSTPIAGARTPTAATNTAPAAGARPAVAASPGPRLAGHAAARPRPQPPATQAYLQTMRGMHRRPDNAVVRRAPNGLPLLVLYTMNLNERTDLVPLDSAGHFASNDLERAAVALRDPATGNRHPVEPLVLAAIYQLQTQFQAHEVRVVSGYRTPRAGTHSNHGRGRAIDFILPGTRDEDVAKVARTRGFSGVGVYPVSGFLHVDVRDRSYFWVDSSGPGRPYVERGVLLDVAKQSDDAARARGDHPPPPFQIATSLGQAAADEAGADADDDDASGDSSGQ